MTAEGSAKEAAHSDEPPKKRAAERQITKDDAPDGSDEEETAPGAGFPKADEATLKTRRILKARHPTAPPPSASVEAHGDETEQQQNNSNPFASISMSTGSVFGSGFGGGFGAATPGTGFGFASSTSGFGSAPESSAASVFGSSTAFSGGLASTTSSESAFGATSKPEPPSVMLPEEVELRNGEEEEECVVEFRAKSHILVDVEETKASEPERPSAPSVPPSSSTAPAARPTSEAGEATDESKSAADESNAEDKKETKEGDTTTSSEKEGMVSNDKEESKEAAQTNGDEKKSQKEWRELGIGPLRILKKDKCHTRVVQRRETQPGGAGTKLIVNVPLPKECTVALQGEKYVRLTTIEPSGKAAIFLLKVKTSKEAQELRDVLEKEIDKAASFVGKSGSAIRLD
jgi:hypothetical protein